MIYNQQKILASVSGYHIFQIETLACVIVSVQRMKEVTQVGPLDSEITSPHKINSCGTSNFKQVAFEL